MAGTTKETLRILIIGSHRARLEKVVSILKDAPYDPNQSSNTTIAFDVEYLPCVAKFDSYQDEQGKTVRYLASVDCYDGDDAAPSSLLPFFDDDAEGHGIAGAAIGSGVEGKEDTSRIRSFFETMVSSSSREDAMPVIRCIEPNPRFATMHEELAAYKALTTEEKEQVTRLQTMGPGKMAKFVSDFAQALIAEAVEKQRPKDDLVDDQHVQNSAATDSADEAPRHPHIIDPEKKQFSCRKCRCILFGEDDLQDPPHVPSKHSFSHRKQHHGTSSSTSTVSNSCQSYFLQDLLDWMGPDNAAEGKFSCPSCDCKLGSWHWSGAQCSCGTWVVPAIQVPKSKVDLILPQSASAPLPPGTVISPILSQQVANVSTSATTAAPTDSRVMGDPV